MSISNTKSSKLIAPTFTKPLKFCEKQDFVENITIFGNALHVSLKEQSSARSFESDHTEILKNENLIVNHISEITPTLEDVFLPLIEKDPANVQ
jgi:hypothetical protein